jgi:hypothetical protein
MLDALSASEPAWQDCVTTLSSPVPDGKITVRLIAAHDETDRPVIETASVDHDHSTIADEALRECLRRTALDIAFESLPTNVPAVAVGFAIRVENGAVAGSEEREFSYLIDAAR